MNTQTALLSVYERVYTRRDTKLPLQIFSPFQIWLPTFNNVLIMDTDKWTASVTVVETVHNEKEFSWNM